MIITLIIILSYLIILAVVCAKAYGKYISEAEISEWIDRRKHNAE